jgi:hypothetical protein
MRLARLLGCTSVIFLAVAATAQQVPVQNLPLSAPTTAEDTIKPPAHPITPDQVRQLMNVAHATDQIQTGMHKMILQQQAAMPIFPAAFWSDFEAEFAKVDWVAIATPIYQKYLSQEDAAKAIDFYSTAAGQQALKSTYAVSGEMSAKGFEIGKAIGARLGAKYQQQIEDAARKLQQAQPTPPN